MFLYCYSLVIIEAKTLQGAKTIVATGMLGNISGNERRNLVELDRSKAFTSALLQIEEVPVFTHFDVWIKYDRKIHDISNVHDLTLYYVRNWFIQTYSIFCKKDYCLFSFF